MNTSLSYSQRIAYCQNNLAKKLLQLMDEKKTNLALSADVTDAKSLLTLADTLGSEICILKTHIDILSDFTPELTQQLAHLAKKHRFLIFEDRKFADIGHTVQLQYEAGIYHIADWADIINAHSIAGPGIIEGLAVRGLANNRGLLLIAELSSSGHLMNEAYKQQTLALAEKYPDFVMGFITQKAVSMDPQWINMTPGVNLSSAGDTLGQQYITPEHAIVALNSDVIIVGRGIYQHTQPLAEAKRYREAGWKAYQQRLQGFK